MSRLLLALFVALGCAASGCQSAAHPELRVVGSRQQVVFVQVTNPASHPMRLSKLDYQFMADGQRTVYKDTLQLDEEVPAGEAIVVEVPLASDAKVPMTLTGTLTAELDQIVRIFQVRAQVQPH
ncbi:MAG TPA: hypothetical protein VGF94_25330 [Kofleriaceae bacterium]|jgi:hypothetical protein